MDVKKYIRPNVTVTDLIQNKKDIAEQLKDFIEIEHDDLEKIPKKTYLKYLTYDKNKKKELFRFGGKLIFIGNEYVVLKGNRSSFSVQKKVFNDKGESIYNTRFFRNKNINTAKDALLLRKELNKTIDKSNKMYLEQSMIIKCLKEENIKLKKKIKQLKKIK
mgnify:CR=1 FL=1|tara:strand:+ start:884 stop:1369 length:486 start_codon:yes stop_codon:yes gene_type:complete